MSDESPDSTTETSDGQGAPRRTPSRWEQTKRELRRFPAFFKARDLRTFETLYQIETRRLDQARHLDAQAAGRTLALDNLVCRIATDVSGEPRVAVTSRDRFGLALSGGGIRSATYNLGLLQALARLNVLEHVDYLSTVSGGGYVGGFWTAWLMRRAQAGDRGGTRFPRGGDYRGGERAEVRHLREFSRFLLPRVGIRRTEFWGVVMTVLSGLIPSMVAALAALVILWSLWILTIYALTSPDPQGWTAFASLLVAFFILTEALWVAHNRRSRPASDASGTPPLWIELLGYAMGAAIAVSSVLAGLLFKSWWLPAALAGRVRVPTDLSLFAPVAVLGGCFVVLVAARTIVARITRPGATGVSFLVGIERSLSRNLALNTALAAVALVWVAAGRLSGLAFGGTLGTTAGLAGLFAWARKWLSEPIQETRGGKMFDTVLRWTKRTTPRVLATLVWLLLLLLVGAALQWAMVPNGDVAWTRFRWVTGVSVGYLALTAAVFDPARVGLHEFYRSRISRCYLGASNVEGLRTELDRVAGNRQVDERPGDDFTLKALQDALVKPLHLVCTAANDLSGDHLATLYRGAKSAVLSANGISIGNDSAPLDYLTFSAALTASAAAFNSQMGRVSMDLGAAVAFLMSALNLRLGLWVQHPRAIWRTGYWLPGRFFLFELLGLSRTDRHHLHLSDGGHFENLGLYELIRRHCRYIIVADCGADPGMTFDDLGNVLRRVREDFGVEIDLDVEPLRRNDTGHAQQHAVVGTIHYGGVQGVDKGTLLYFKPVLTGDEPPDILQYRSRNSVFPHESTGDQFYDEAQWESYRRLGEHACLGTLSFAETIAAEREFTDRVFVGVRERLHPAAKDHQDVFLQMSDRCATLEADVFSDGPLGLRRELFPEAVALGAGTREQIDEEIRSLSYMMRAIQIMEDVWVSADLNRYWSHPLNEGWMNYFQRWASTPTFRRWWPLLRPLYNNGFRDFARERFGVGVRDLQVPRKSDAPAALGLHLEPEPDRHAFMNGHAWRQFLQRSTPPNLAPLTILAYRMDLPRSEAELEAWPSAPKTLDVGFVLARETQAGDRWTATWHARHFFVPTPLVGSGIIGRQLDALIAHYRAQAAAPAPRVFGRLTVVFGGAASPRPRGRAAIEERVRDIDFFKSRGFQHEQGNAWLGDVTLSLPL